MKYLISSPPPNSANQNYTVLGHCDGYVYLQAALPSSKIYRKPIFDVTGWKKMKAFTEMAEEECLCSSLIPSHQSIVMLFETDASINLCCYSLKTGEMKTYKCSTDFERIYPFHQAVYQLFFLSNSQIRCYPSKLFFDDGDSYDFPFFIFNLDHQTSTFRPFIDFGLVFHEDIDDFQSISNISFISQTSLVYQYIKNGAQHYCKIDLEKLSASQESSTPDDKGFITVDPIHGAVKVYECESFYKHVHQYIRKNDAGNIEFYNFEGFNGIIKGEVELIDNDFICKESSSNQIFYKEFIDFYSISSFQLYFDDKLIFIPTPDYFITGYHMVRTLKDIAYLSLLPKINSKELSSLSPFYQFTGFIEDGPKCI